MEKKKNKKKIPVRAGLKSLQLKPLLFCLNHFIFLTFAISLKSEQTEMYAEGFQ